jgi:hypothetical protein
VEAAELKQAVGELLPNGSKDVHRLLEALENYLDDRADYCNRQKERLLGLNQPTDAAADEALYCRILAAYVGTTARTCRAHRP